MKTKLIITGIAIIMIIGGTGVFVLHSHQSKIETSKSPISQTTQQSASKNPYDKKAVVGDSINNSADNQKEEAKDVKHSEQITLLKVEKDKEAEIKEDQQNGVISTEYLSIGMILDPKQDIPGAKYEDIITNDGVYLGRKPVNLPKGYDSNIIGLGTGNQNLTIITLEGDYKIIGVGYKNKDGIHELLSPEEGWKLYKEYEEATKPIGNLSPQEMYVAMERVGDNFMKKYGYIPSPTIINVGTGIGPVIVVGSDGHGWYRSIVNSQ